MTAGVVTGDSKKKYLSYEFFWTHKKIITNVFQFKHIYILAENINKNVIKEFLKYSQFSKKICFQALLWIIKKKKNGGSLDNKKKSVDKCLWQILIVRKISDIETQNCVFYSHFQDFHFHNTK